MDPSCIGLWKTANLLWRSWDGEDLVFNPASGSTHILNPMAAKTLKVLSKEPANAIQLSKLLASTFELDVDDQIVKHVVTLLANLDEMGLIERVSQ